MQRRASFEVVFFGRLLVVPGPYQRSERNHHITGMSDLSEL